MNVIKQKKYAVVVGGKTITEYIYDEVNEMSNTIFGVLEKNNNVHTIHAYDKETGKILFKKEKIATHEIVDNCIIICLEDGRIYIYFDLEKTIRGSYACAHVKHNESVVVVSKIVKGNNNKFDRVYGAYYTDREEPLMFPIKYDYINLELENIIPITYKGYVGIADYSGNLIFAPKYNGIDSYFGHQILDLYSSERNTSTLIDEYGDITCHLDTNYSIDSDDDLKLLFVENDGKYGIYDDEGTEIFPICIDNYFIDRDVVEILLGSIRFAYIPKIDKVVDINGYKYTRNGKLKVLYGRRWRTIEDK